LSADTINVKRLSDMTFL